MCLRLVLFHFICACLLVFFVFAFVTICVRAFTLQDWELFRVFDSLILEDEEANSVETGHLHEGALGADQTRDIMTLCCNAVCVLSSFFTHTHTTSTYQIRL